MIIFQLGLLWVIKDAIQKLPSNLSPRLVKIQPSLTFNAWSMDILHIELKNHRNLRCDELTQEFWINISLEVVTWTLVAEGGMKVALEMRKSVIV